MQIRPAVPADVPVLVEMGRHQVRALYGGAVAENTAQLTALTEHMVTAADRIVLVAERDGKPVGMIGMVLFDHHISGQRTAGEVAWWLEPDARGAGTVLLKAAERWAAEQGATTVQMMAPDSRVGYLYARRGYQLLEMTYSKPVDVAMIGIRVVDDVLPEPSSYAAQTRQQTFRDVEMGPNVVFHGIAEPVDNRLIEWLVAKYPALTPTLTFVRQSPEHQDEPNYVHTDVDMGEWTGIYYMNNKPPSEDGTTFWRDRLTGDVASIATDEQANWGDASRWEPWHTVEARLNRLVLFPAAYFHSRALHDNYGTGDDARLIQVVFGMGQVG